VRRYAKRVIIIIIIIIIIKDIYIAQNCRGPLMRSLYAIVVCLSVCPSVRPSVCLSVCVCVSLTLRYCIKTANSKTVQDRRIVYIKVE